MAVDFYSIYFEPATHEYPGHFVVAKHWFGCEPRPHITKHLSLAEARDSVPMNARRLAWLDDEPGNVVESYVAALDQIATDEGGDGF